MKISKNKIRLSFTAMMVGVATVCGWAAPEKVDPVVENLKPLVGHILKPREFIDLTGRWDFAKVPKIEEKYPDPKDATKQLSRFVRNEKVDFNNLKWTQIKLPKMQSCWHREDQYYRTFFGLPSDLSNKRIVIKFEKAVDTLFIIVNGKKYDPVPTYELPWEFDITDSVKPGANEIIANVYNGFDERAWAYWPQIHGWAMAGYWGLSRPIHVEIMDKVFIDLPIVRTSVVSNKVLTLLTTVRNTTDKDVKARVEAKVMKDAYRSEFFIKAPEAVIPAKGEYTFVASSRWDNAVLWDPEHPNLYNIDISVIEDKTVRDAYRQRFGFREVSIVGNQFMINGKPYIHRRNGGVTGAPDIEAMKKSILELRSLGITGHRLFGGDWVRLLEAADEAGFMTTPVAPCGNGANWKAEEFWPRLELYQQKMVKTFINHPSVLAWALGNEFGTIYGGAEGRPEEKPGTDHEVAAARKVEAIDPTRGWTYCGECDLGYPVRQTIGPAPIRSFHYPISTCRDGITFPESGYWYADGILSWQRIGTHDKPLSISEDIFHGTTDQHLGMAKTGGDSIYTTEGYAKTLHYIIRCMAEGHYYAGLGAWHTWVTEHNRPENMLNKFGQLIPNFLITTRENFVNLRSGENVTRNVYCYNQLFTPYECDLVREDIFEGKTVFTETRKFLLDQGMKHHEQMQIAVPVVKKPTQYQVKFTLRTGDRVLDSRTYDYTVFPKMEKVNVPSRLVLLANEDSVLAKSKFTFVSDDVKKILDKKPRAIVVAKDLTTDEGRVLNDYVIAGGKVMIVEASSRSWVPVTLEFKRPLSFLWRRNDDCLLGLQESWMKAWMPDHTLGDASYPKPLADTRILWDCGQTYGLTNANILWLNKGKGAFFLCQLPVLSRFVIEPAAPYVIEQTLAEFAKDIPDIQGAAVPMGSVKDTCTRLGILTKEKELSKKDVLILDISKDLTAEELAAFESHTKKGGNALLIEPREGTNTALMAKLGLSATAIKKTMLDHREKDVTAKWLVRKHNHGIMAGIAIDDTLMLNNVGSLWGVMLKRMCGDADPDGDRWSIGRPAEPILSCDMALTEKSKAEFLTDPAGIASLKYKSGTVVVTSLMFSKFAESQHARCARLMRTLLNNLGATTVEPERVHSYEFIDMKSVFNRNFWNDPLYRKDDGTFEPKGWFGDDNDFRYFPVNLCGWSLAARNFCPKEDFPTEPLNLGGRHFTVQNPSLNNGKSLLHLSPGEKVKIQLPSNFKAQKIYFLGVGEGRRERDSKTGRMRNTSTILEVTSPAIKEPWTFKLYEHFGIARFACSTSKGTVAWSGPTLKDDQASVYHWYGVNQNPDTVIPYVELENKSEIDNIIIIAMTAELPDRE